MNIFLLQHGTETGPFRWSDILVMLQKGMLDETTSVRIGDETQSIQDWNLWTEGAEVGPLSWEDISQLLQEGVLGLETPARFDQTSELGSLRDVIAQSQEIEYRPEAPPASHPRTFSLGPWRIALDRLWPRAALPGTILLIGGTTLYFFFNGSRSSKPPIPESVLTQAIATATSETNSNPIHSTSQPKKSVGVEDHSYVGRDATPLASVAKVDSMEAVPQTSHPALESTTTTVIPKEQPSGPGELPSSLAPTEPQQPATAPIASAPVPPHPATPVASQRPPHPPEQAPQPTPTPAAHQETAPITAQTSQGAPATPPTSPRPEPSPAPSPQNATRVTRNTPPSPAPPPEKAVSFVGDFFKIHSVKFLTKEPRDGIGVWNFEEVNKRQLPSEFLPTLAIEVSARENIGSDKLKAKAYFFDQNNTLVATSPEPSAAGAKSNPKHYAMPVIFHSEKPVRLFFAIPEKVAGLKWKAVLVFGDKHEAQSACYPHTESDFLLTYPEKKLVYDRSTRVVNRKMIADQVIEYVAKTRNPKHPQITMFLRPPKGITDWSEVQGVYALVVLANSVEDIRRRMQAVELEGDEAGSFAFANKHKLAILMWGSRRIWNPRMNFDEYNRQEARELDRDFDMVANAWEQAIQHFHKEYGIPTTNFILRGSCGAAQWAKRLCLRKPDYFLAAHVHLAGSYDQPTPEAAKVLWCVTTTEQDGGYEGSKRFLVACREMGYPIMYKAATPQAGIGALGDQFFEYAMTLKDRRAEYEKQMKDRFQLPAATGQPPRPWVEAFAAPPFYGDVVNQELFPSEEIDMIPAVFRSPIPTKKLADIWKGN